jgi:hypothetical protein
VFVAEMRTGSQNTKHNPETRTTRQNWKRNESVDASALAMMGKSSITIELDLKANNPQAMKKTRPRFSAQYQAD